MTKVKTAHDKKVELAKAGASKYGIYFDAGSSEEVVSHIKEFVEQLSLILNIENCGDKAKISAIEFIKNSSPSVKHANVSNCSIDLS